jgi:hypothetical protein
MWSISWTVVDWYEIAMTRFRHAWNWNCLD